MTGWGPFDLTGKNAVVTGGAMGIGFGIARRFVEAGASVLIVDIDERAAEAAARRLADGPGRTASLRADVSETQAGERIVAACVEHFGSLDIFVNNAGIYPIVPMLQTTADLFDKVYAINLRGLAFCTKAAAAQMIRQGKGGKIVNVASVDSIRPSMVGLAAYDASKGGVLMFTKNVALELAPHGIQVNAIAPGGIATEGSAKLMETLPAEARRRAEQFAVARVPMGKMGAPEDIGNAAVFLAAAASDYITGEILVVDGGALLT